MKQGEYNAMISFSRLFKEYPLFLEYIKKQGHKDCSSLDINTIVNYSKINKSLDKELMLVFYRFLRDKDNVYLDFEKKQPKNTGSSKKKEIIAKVDSHKNTNDHISKSDDLYYCTVNVSFPKSLIHKLIYNYIKSNCKNELESEEVFIIPFFEIYRYLQDELSVNSVNRRNLRNFLIEFYSLTSELVIIKKTDLFINRGFNDTQEIEIQESLRNNKLYKIFKKLFALIVIQEELFFENLKRINIRYYIFLIETLSGEKISSIISEKIVYSVLHYILSNISFGEISKFNLDSKEYNEWFKHNEEEIISKINNYFLYYNIQFLINEIPFENYKFRFQNSLINELSEGMNFVTIEDFLAYLYNNHQLLNFENKKLIINTLKRLRTPFTLRVKEIIHKLILPVRKIDILLKHYQGETLEKIGEVYNLTRERVRQIEKKGYERILKEKNILNEMVSLLRSISHDDYFISSNHLNFLNENELELLKLFLYLLFESRSGYLNKDNIIIELSSEKLFDKIDNWILENIDKYEIVYDIDSIKDKIIEDIGVNQNSSSMLHKYIDKEIKKLYYLKNDKYVYKKLRKIDIFRVIVRENFPEGINLYNNDIQNFISIYLNEYSQTQQKKYNLRTFQAALQRFLVVVDRGTYDFAEKIPEIPDILLEEIMELINFYDGPMFIKMLFSYFDKELQLLGITNHYSFQSALRKVQEKYQLLVSKDYVSKRETNQKNSKYSSIIIKYCLNLNRVFLINELGSKFSAVSPIYIENTLRNSEKFVLLGNKKWIPLSLIEHKDPIQLKNAVDLFLKEEKFISIKEVFSYLLLKHNNLLKDFYIDSHSSLYSVVQKLFSEDYSFKKPYIGRESIELLNTKDQILLFFEDKDEIEIKDLKEYLVDRRLKTNNYNSIYDEIKETYIPVNKNALIKKTFLGINENNIRLIHSLVSKVIKKSGELRLSKFNLYSFLPDINYPWNNILLSYVIRDFLNEQFSVISTDSRFLEGDYIILPKSYNINNYEEYIGKKRRETNNE